MKAKKLLTLVLSLGLFVSFTEPVNAKNISIDSNEICTKNPEYETRKKDVDIAKTELENAKKELKNAETDKTNAENTVVDATTGVQNAQNALDSASGTVADAQNKLTDAGNAKNEAQTNMSNAQTAKDEADKTVEEKQNVYDATQDKSNPEWQKRQEAVDNTKTELDTAKEEKKAAETEKANAETAVADAEKCAVQKKTDFKNANSALANAQKNVDAAQAMLDEAKANQSEAQNGVDKANDVVSAAKNAVDSAVAEREQLYKELEAKKTTLDNANKLAQNASMMIAKGSVGYFESNGNTTAVDIIQRSTSLDNWGADAKKGGLTQIGQENDATTLENMKLALEYILKANEIRKANGLPEFKVVDELMAEGQVGANMEAITGNHTFMSQNSSDPNYKGSMWGENLVNGYSDPFVGWYNEEYAVHDALNGKNVSELSLQEKADLYDYLVENWDQEKYGNTDSFTKTQKAAFERTFSGEELLSYKAMYIQTGHYDTLMNANVTTTGYGFCSRVTAQSWNGKTSTQKFGNETGLDENVKVYNVQEYYNQFMAYYNSLYNADANKVEAQKAYDEALAKAQQAEQDVKAKTEDLSSAKSDAEKAASRLNDAKNATEQAQADRDAVNTDAEQEAVTAAENAKKAADQAVTDAKNRLEEKKQAVADAQAKIDEAEANLEAAQSSLDELSAGAVEAKKALEDAKAEAEKADKALEDAQKAFGEKTDLYSEAEANKEAADKAVADAAAAKEEADRKLADAQADLDAKQAIANAAQTKVDFTEAKFEEAQKALNALGHAWKEPVVKEPTCTEEGLKVYTCENCGETKEETLPALGHDYSKEWTVDKEATYYEDGSKSHHCTRCDAKIDVTVIPRLSFVDVNETTDHYDDILWLATNKVTAGWDIGNGHKEFRPYVDVARCDMAAFIRRLAVSNNWLDAATWTPDEEDWNTFTDIDKNSPHAEDVLWLAHTGISEGWTEEDGTKTFRPLVTVARCDMAAFLQRLASKQGLSDAATWQPSEADWTFADIDTNSPHAEEVLWLAHSGVSKGWSEEDGTTTFRPYIAVARCDMAAFLRRMVG